MSEFPPRGALSVSYGEACHRGKVREENQDSIRSASIPLGDLFIVADGIGGYQGGATASRMVVEGFLAQLAALPANYPAGDALAEACAYTNASIYAAANTGDPKLQRMGSTVVLALVQPGEAADCAPAAPGPTAWVGHIGDSRAYLIRGGKMTRITSDHSAVQVLVSRNLITEEEARNHPDASVLTRSLGHRPEVEIEVDRVPLQGGDALLLCSDGLWGYAAEADMAAIATDPNLSVEKVAEYLLDLALSSGGHDNIGIEFFRIGGAGAPAAAAGPAPMKGSQRSTLPSMSVIKTAPFARPSEAAPSPALAATPEPPARPSGHRKQIVIAVCLLALAVGGALGLVARSHLSASSHKTDYSGEGSGAGQIPDPAPTGPFAPQRGGGAKHSSGGTVQPGAPGSNPRPNSAASSSGTRPEARVFGIAGEIDLGPYRAPAPEEIPLRHTTIRRESKAACVNLATAETVAYVNKPELSNEAIVEAIVKSYPKIKDHMEAHAVMRREMTQEVKDACGSNYDAIVILASKVAAKASAAPANAAPLDVPHMAGTHDRPAAQFRLRQAGRLRP